MNPNTNSFTPGRGGAPPPPGQYPQPPPHGYYPPQQHYQHRPQQGYVGHPQSEYYPQDEQYDYYDDGYGGGYDQDVPYDDEDDEIDLAIAEMEAELENAHFAGAAQSGGHGGAGEKLPPFAHEMWFPECRNCQCCKGYKHGCSCCGNGCTTCTKLGCSSTATARGGGLGNTAPSAPAKAGGPDTEFWYPEARNCTCCQGFKYKCPCVCERGAATCTNSTCLETDRGVSAPSSNPKQPPTDQADGGLIIIPPDHDDEPVPVVAAPMRSTTATVRAPPTGGSKTMCRFFQQGSCRYGTSCRFSH